MARLGLSIYQDSHNGSVSLQHHVESRRSLEENDSISPVVHFIRVFWEQKKTAKPSKKRFLDDCLNECKRLIANDPQAREYTLELTDILVRILRKKRNVATRKALNIFLDHYPFFEYCKKAHIKMMKAALYVLKMSLSAPFKLVAMDLVKRFALAAVSDSWTKNLDDALEARYIAFCSEGGVECLLQAEASNGRSIDTIFHRLYRHAKGFCKYYKLMESDGRMKDVCHNDLFLTYCQLSLIRLEMFFKQSTMLEQECFPTQEATGICSTGESRSSFASACEV